MVLSNENSLDKYIRDNQYVKDLFEAFDKYVEIDLNGITKILERIYKILDEDNGQPEKPLDEILKENDLIQKQVLEKRFAYELKDNHSQYIRILRRFTFEHLKHKESISFIIKYEILAINDVLRRLEKDYFDHKNIEGTIHDRFMYELRDICDEILNELISNILNEFSVYIIGQDIDFQPQEKPDDNSILPTISLRVMLLNELGIIKYLRESYPSLEKNNTSLSKVFASIMNANSDTVRRAIDEIGTGRKNDPYKTEKNLKRIENFCNTSDLGKKGE